MHKYWQSIVSHHTHVPHVSQPDFTRFHFSIPNLNKFHPVVLPTRSTPSLVICSRTSPSCITLFSFSFLQRLRHKAARSQQEPSPKIVKLFSSRAARRQVHVHAGPCTEPSCRVNDDWECVNKRWGHKGVESYWSHPWIRDQIALLSGSHSVHAFRQDDWLLSRSKVLRMWCSMEDRDC